MTGSPDTPSPLRRLPQASPSSARLRKIAPSPVTIHSPSKYRPSSRGATTTTYRQWATASTTQQADIGGSNGRDGSAGQSAEGGTEQSGGEEEEDEDDPFDLEIQFAPPPSAGPYSDRHDLSLPIQLHTQRQSSCVTNGTASTFTSFSTSPIYLSFQNQHLPPSLRNPPTDIPNSTGNRTRSSRTIPDVPDEILDEPFGLSTSSHSGSEEDARGPTRRTGAELLSPKAFLATHVPLPVKVQFRDVFGGNDTISPHLPASVIRPPINSPVTSIPPLPSSTEPHHPATPRPGRSGLSNTPLGPSPRSPPISRTGKQVTPVQFGKSPGSVSLAGSFGTFGVHRSGGSERNRRDREESGNSDRSFTFSAYHLADDDPSRIARKGSTDSEVEMRVTKVISSRPVPRSNHHHPPPPTTRDNTPRAINVDSFLPFESTPQLDQSDWIHPFARPPGKKGEEEDITPSRPNSDCIPSSDDGDREEIITPLLSLVSDSGADVGVGDIEEDHNGTPTPASRVREHGLGLDLQSDNTSYFPPPIPSPTPSSSTDVSSIPVITHAQRQRVPKMMQDDYNFAIEHHESLGINVGDGTHPSYPYPHPSEESSTAQQPKKFKSLASLRRRLPSSRGGPLPPVPPPQLIGHSTESRYSTEYISLTGKPLPSRPSHPPTSSTIPPPPGESFFDFGVDAPLLTGTSVAFSVNSVQSASTGSHGHPRKEDEWKGCLKKDLNLNGLVVHKDMTLNLWVDQENCREVISTLHVIRYHPPSKTRTRALDRIDNILGEKKTFDDLDEVMDDSHDEGGYFWDEGCVEFGMNPWNRAKWTFTYGALEAFPSLRRVTMDGKQNYDFTSRIASLKHRQSGIYAVCGEEKNGARWRFRYMVDIPLGNDPRARIIVPMSFYVNPSFIRGTHASRLGVKHMIHKAFRTNLQSTKMITPGLIAPPPLKPLVDDEYSHSRSSTSNSNRSSGMPIAIQVQVETVIDRDRTPKQGPMRTYRPEKGEGGGGGEGESSHLIPKSLRGNLNRPSTAQEPRRPLPLSSLTPLNSTSTRIRPGTANNITTTTTTTAQLDKSRVAPFLSPQQTSAPHSRSTTTTTSASAPSIATSRLSAAFGRSRAFTLSSRPSTPLSAPLPPVPESSTPKSSGPASAFVNGVMRAKKSLSNLRPPSRPGTGNGRVEPPLPTCSSVGSVKGLEVPVVGGIGRLRTKSNNYVIGENRGNIRPSTAGNISTGIIGGKENHTRDNYHYDGVSSLSKPRSSSNIRPSTANPLPLPSSTYYTPHQLPPTQTRGLTYGYGTYTDTPPSGITSSSLAMQQLEAKRTPGMLRREFGGGERWVEGARSGSGMGLEGRRPRTADPRGNKVSMI